jgi:hypothetical protein
MGLDMYIHRQISAPEPLDWQSWPAWNAKRELAYWRKHPNLHGFIVNTYANGADECQEIPLTAADILAILRASEEDRLPETSGFFFGKSLPEDKETTRDQLTRILALLEQEPETQIYYRASW